MMHYTNRDQFIVSAPGCMYTDPDSLESIMAGNERSANGCTLPLDMTRDGIAVLCSHGGFCDTDGTFHAVGEAEYIELRRFFPKIVAVGQAIELAKSCAAKICIDLKNPAVCTFHAVGEAEYIELRRFFPKIVAVGQAIELAKSCAAKICIDLKNPAVCPQVKIALSHADYLDNAYFGGLDLPAAAAAARKNPALHMMGDLPGTPADVTALIRATQEALDNAYFGGLDLPAAAAAARKNPALHMMGDLPGTPADVTALIRATQEAGLFGLRAAPAVLTAELCEEALRCGLFLASTETTDTEELARMLEFGVNFIETERPDLAQSLLPSMPDEE